MVVIGFLHLKELVVVSFDSYDSRKLLALLVIMPTDLLLLTFTHSKSFCVRTWKYLSDSDPQLLRDHVAMNSGYPAKHTCHCYAFTSLSNRCIQTTLTIYGFEIKFGDHANLNLCLFYLHAFCSSISFEGISWKSILYAGRSNKYWWSNRITEVFISCFFNEND